jgi:hypothetical protein
MLKSATSKVMWLGRATVFVVGLAVILALTVGLASTALAGSGVGATFNLGKTNTVSAISKLVGSVAGPSLLIDNNSTNSAATALDLQVEADKTPMKVNSGTKVANLNVDKLGGLEPSQIKGAKAYTEVVANPNSLPTLVSATTSGFNSGERVAPGTYCLTAPDLTSDNSTAVVSVEYTQTTNPETIAEAFPVFGGGATTGCGDGRFMVITERMFISNGALGDQRVSDVSFYIAVP